MKQGPEAQKKPKTHNRDLNPKRVQTKTQRRRGPRNYQKAGSAEEASRGPKRPAHQKRSRSPERTQKGPIKPEKAQKTRKGAEEDQGRGSEEARGPRQKTRKCLSKRPAKAYNRRGAQNKPASSEEAQTGREEAGPT